MKKLFLPLAILILFAAYYWRAGSSRSETGLAVEPTPTISDPIERHADSTAPARPLPAAAAPAARSDVVAAFERKRLAARDANAAPLPPPMDTFRDMQKTDVQTINDRPFHLLAATAVPRDRFSGSMGKVLLDQNGFVVFEAKSVAPGWEQAIFRADARPVLVNPNGHVAIMTGTLLIKVRDLADVAAIAASEGLEVITQDQDIRTAYLRPPEGYALLPGQKRLQADARVERVELELYQGRKERK